MLHNGVEGEFGPRRGTTRTVWLPPRRARYD
jgi:hypothetical protein